MKLPRWLDNLLTSYEKISKGYLGFGRISTMDAGDIERLVDEYADRPDDELINTVVANYDLTDAIISTHPNMAQDAGFDLFDVQWARRYWRTLAADVSGLKLPDQVQSWAVSSTISGVAAAIITTYGLPAVAVSAAVALAVLLVRAARSGEG
jgi:hypothetical protein